MTDEIDVERIMSAIRGTARGEASRTPVDSGVERSPTREAVALERAIGEVRHGTDLYAARGMPPTRFWIPWPLSALLVPMLRYFLAWQVHWNGAVARALAEVQSLLGRIERWVDTRLAERDQRIAELAAQLEDCRRQAAAIDQRTADLERRDAGTRERERVSDRAYVEFEDTYRGSEEEVRRRQEVHVTVFREALDAQPSLREDDGFVLDLGCGRGEMLELLQSAAVPCRGVDVNASMVGRCREKQLDVSGDDLFAFLEALPAGSLAGAISCQVIEHLGPADVARLADLLFEKLRPGAALVLETVNPENLLVSAHTFYLDLSHRTKIPAAALVHLLASRGFEILSTRYLSPCAPEEQLRTLPENDPAAATVNENFRRLSLLLYGPRDYAVTCRKPRPAEDPSAD